LHPTSFLTDGAKLPHLVFTNPRVVGNEIGY